MAIEAVEVVDPIEEPYWVVEKMELGKMGLGLDSVGNGDRKKVVDRAVNKPTDMSLTMVISSPNWSRLG